MSWLADAEWDAVQRVVPILCVDAVPVRRALGRVEVGLIKRHNPFGPDPLWCQIGGRVRRDELLTAALRRHLCDALDGLALPATDGDLQPAYTMQWLPGGPTEAAPWVGADPRKHAVSLCYSIPVTDDVTHRPGGEALAFDWFDPEALPQLWPGTRHMVDALLARTDLSRWPLGLDL